MGQQVGKGQEGQPHLHQTLLCYDTPALGTKGVLVAHRRHRDRRLAGAFLLGQPVHKVAVPLAATIVRLALHL